MELFFASYLSGQIEKIYKKSTFQITLLLVCWIKNYYGIKTEISSFEGLQGHIQKAIENQPFF